MVSSVMLLLLIFFILIVFRKYIISFLYYFLRCIIIDKYILFFLFFILLLDFCYFFVNFASFLVCLFFVSLYFFGIYNNIVNIYLEFYKKVYGVEIDSWYILEYIRLMFNGGLGGYDNAGAQYWSNDKVNLGRESFYEYSRSLEELKLLTELYKEEYDYLSIFFYRRKVLTASYKPIDPIDGFSLDNDPSLLDGLYYFEFGGVMLHLVACLLVYILLLNTGYLYQYLFWSRKERFSYMCNKHYYFELGKSGDLRSFEGFKKFTTYFFRRSIFLFHFNSRYWKFNKSSVLNVLDSVNLQDNFIYNYTYNNNVLEDRYNIEKSYYNNGVKSLNYTCNEKVMSKLKNHVFFFGLNNFLHFEQYYLSSFWYSYESDFLRFNFKDVELEDYRSSIDYLLNTYLGKNNYSLFDYGNNTESLINYYTKHSLDNKFGDLVNLFVPYVDQGNVSVVKLINYDSFVEEVNDDETDFTMYEDIYDGWIEEYDKALEEYIYLYNDSWWIGRSKLGVDFDNQLTDNKGLNSFFGSRYLVDYFFSEKGFSDAKGIKKSLKDNINKVIVKDISDEDYELSGGLKNSLSGVYASNMFIVLIQGGLFMFLYLIFEQDDWLWDGKDGIEYPFFNTWLLNSYRSENIDLYFTHYFPDLEAFFYVEDLYPEPDQEFLDQEKPDLEIVEIDFNLSDLLYMLYDLKLFFYCFLLFLFYYLCYLYWINSMFIEVYYLFCQKYLSIINFVYFEYLSYYLLIFGVFGVILYVVYYYFVIFGVLMKLRFIRR